MAGNANIGSLFVDLGINTAKFSDGLKSAQSKLSGFASKLGSVGKNVAMIGGAMAAGMGAAVASVTASVIPSIVEYERLGASLRTVMGSAEAAGVQFKELQKFAAQTPFQLTEVVDGFNKMKAMGLDPSIEAMRAYGDMSGAMGKDLNMMVEAVADAATGEFERLKEFGIRAASEGDRVKFTFGGVTTEVGKNSAEIQKYLQELAQTKFAGAMELQSATLAGAWSNLQDATGSLAASIGAGGLSSALQTVIKDISGGVAGSLDLGTAMGKVMGDGILMSWDALKKLHSTLKPVIDGAVVLGRQVFDFLAPSFSALFKSVGNLMSGPFGGAMLSMSKALGSVIGGAFVIGVRAAVDVLGRLVSALDFVSRRVAPMADAIGVHVGRIAKAFAPATRAMEVFRSTADKMENDVTRNSYVPDMVTEIQRQMRLSNEAFASGAHQMDVYAQFAARLSKESTSWAFDSAADRASAAMGRMRERNAVPQWVENTSLGQAATSALSSTDWIRDVQEGLAQAANDNAALRQGFANTFADGLTQAFNGRGGD
ncbi:MAG: tape measure protein, partial [Notoacmeibacter sp.]